MTQKKILHLVTDEKFTDYAIKQFSAPEMCSEFVLIPSNYPINESKVKYIDNVRIVEQNSKEFEQLLLNLNQYCSIILHGMFWPQWQIPLLEVVPERVKIAWVFWGGEIYGQPDIANGFLAPIDRFLNQTHFFRRKLMGKNEKFNFCIPKEIFKKVDYCLTSMKVEYEFVKQYLGMTEMKYKWYNYYSIEETLGTAFDKQCLGNNIWIGNSATIECNYFDLLMRLRKMNINDRHIILPLAYGEPWARTRISKAYHFVFGKNFKPQLDFIPRDIYNEKLRSCSVMIQPHYLSQGVGNILTGLWLGMRVYLSEKCITYGYLKQIGVKFFSIEQDLRKDNPDVFAPLPQDMVGHNRKMLLKETGLLRTTDANMKLVEELTKEE